MPRSKTVVREEDRAEFERLLGALVQGPVTMVSVAARLGVSRQTLYGRLKGKRVVTRECVLALRYLTERPWHYAEVPF